MNLKQGLVSYIEFGNVAFQTSVRGVGKISEKKLINQTVALVFKILRNGIPTGSKIACFSYVAGKLNVRHWDIKPKMRAARAREFFTYIVEAHIKVALHRNPQATIIRFEIIKGTGPKFIKIAQRKREIKT
ncbi:MAG: hypothetical protein Q8R36_03030 [bacterium]|nr:hypothetical protein [bacterium]